MKKTVVSSLFLVASAALLSACSSPVSLDAPAGSSSGHSSAASSLFGYSEYRCDADPAQKLVGKTYTEGLENEARSLSGARVLRVLRPGQVITMEYDPERLNLRLDESDTIESVGCG